MKKIICIILLLLCCAIESQADQKKMLFSSDEEFIRHLEGLISCQKVGPGEGNLYCFLKFRGLEIEWAGINSPQSTIYIQKLGDKQRLSHFGCNCIAIAFGDEDLRTPEHSFASTEILIHKNGTIAKRYNNKPFWEKCHSH